ncbi:unnamed protein product, partial [Schistosoma intercalatum]
MHHLLSSTPPLNTCIHLIHSRFINSNVKTINTHSVQQFSHFIHVLTRQCDTFTIPIAQHNNANSTPHSHTLQLHTVDIHSEYSTKLNLHY